MSCLIKADQLSHYIAAKFCGHTVLEVKFFSLNTGNSLGYVKHSYRARWYSPFTNLIIGVAPIAGGLVAIYCVTLFLVPSLTAAVFTEINPLSLYDDIVSYWANLGTVMKHQLENALFWVWGALVIHIAMFCVPSKTDFQGASKGIYLVAAIYFASILAFGLDNVIHVFVSSIMATVIPIYLLSSGVALIVLMILKLITLTRTAIIRRGDAFSR